MNEEYEFWSLKEQRAYTKENITFTMHKGIAIVSSPTGEPLVVKKR